MQAKKVLVWLMLILLLCLTPAMAGAETLRGYEKGNGWQYVYFGEYPYERDGTVAPVLWRILDITDNQALMLTEYVIDTQQIIFETDQKKIDKGDYRRITSYEESDLYTWMNTVALDTLLGSDPIRNTLVDVPGQGKLFILTMEQYLNTDYGFSANKWDNQPTRHAEGTPYALKARGLYKDTTGKVSYWAAGIKAVEGTRFALVGYNGHLSWGGYTRKNVGLRMAVQLDLSQLTVTGGSGTKKDPFLFTYTGGEAYVPEVTAQPVQAEVIELPAATEVPAVPTATAPAAETTAASTSKYRQAVTMAPLGTAAATNPPAAATNAPSATEDAVIAQVSTLTAPAAAPEADGEVLLSFVGDCSIGDSYQYADYDISYHSTIDEQGYAWPFSLVYDHLAADDLTVANLEVVFTERKAHTDKMYNLVGAPDHVNTLLEGSVEMVNTVNNHCMDFHNSGYEDTLAILDNAGVDRFGTVYPGQKNGHDDLGIKEIDGIRFGFIGFTYPQETDKKKIANRIKTLKEEEGCDIVVVSLHWGRETHTTPTAGQVAMAKEIINAGADVIWGHHAHVIQPIHFYKGKPILYSTGNFTFGTMSDVDPATGIFQLAYEKVDGAVQLKRLQVIPCETQGSPDYRPYELTDEAARRAVFKKLVLKKTYKNCVNPPDSFLETGVINFENGEMLP